MRLIDLRRDSPSETTRASLRPDDPFEALGFIPIAGNNTPSLQVPIGGCLAYLSNMWCSTTTDAWAIQTVSLGVTLEFISTPPRRFIKCSRSPDPSKRALMEVEIQHLLSIRAIEPVSPEHQGTRFYSILFLVQKKSGGSRAILDLKCLDIHIRYRCFKMHSLHSILGGIRFGDYLSLIDLPEAYLHVPIRLYHRSFLRFCTGRPTINTEQCPLDFLPPLTSLLSFSM